LVHIQFFLISQIAETISGEEKRDNTHLLRPQA